MGVPDAQATRYAEHVRQGAALVTVRTDTDHAQALRAILDRDGAMDLDAGGDTIEIVEERLQVGKREVDRGGVRIRSFVTEKAVSADVTLREEHVDLQRTKVDRPAKEADFQTGTIEMHEISEVPVVAKEARVVEEISLGKTATEHTETVRDTVRRMDVEVENVGASAETDSRYETYHATARPDANFARFAPAYAYGEQLARDPAFGGAEWSVNEASYRSRWESRNPGTWDEFKGAVKHAFEAAKNKI